MDKKQEILSAFAEEMRRHNSVKRRINLIGQIIAWVWVLLFAILVIYALLCPIYERKVMLTKSYQYEAL